YTSAPHLLPQSFPTRRSSDLANRTLRRLLLCVSASESRRSWASLPWSSWGRVTRSILRTRTIRTAGARSGIRTAFPASRRARSRRGISPRKVASGKISIRPCCCRSRSEEHTSELQSRGHLVCRLLLEKKKNYYGL